MTPVGQNEMNITQATRLAEELGDAFALGYADALSGITPLTPLPNDHGQRDAYSLGFQLARQHQRKPPSRANQ